MHDGWGHPNVHTTDYGHAPSAKAFEAVMPPPIGTVVVLPSNGASLSGNQYLDALPSPGVTQVQYELSGGTLSDSVIAMATPTLIGWIANWNTTAVPSGTYTLQSVASAGELSGTSAGITLTVNNPPPTTTVVLPSSSATLSGNRYIDATASSGATSVSTNWAVAVSPTR